MPPQQPTRGLVTVAQMVRRSRVVFTAIVIIMIIFVVRLFDVQVVQHAHYQAAALSDQLKQYQIPATRGLIEAHEGNTVVPIVLNQELYTLYVDPTLVKDPASVAPVIASVIGGSAASYQQEMVTKNTRYVVMGLKLSEDQSNAILSHKFPGIGTQGQDYRTYPQGSLASQTLGFVNDSGQGEYGIEQALNSELAGTPGLLKAVTDVNGVPLAANSNNVSIQVCRLKWKKFFKMNTRLQTHRVSVPLS
jgi:cell division protein FtsI/penicillin-binding protein 2